NTFLIPPPNFFRLFFKLFFNLYLFSIIEPDIALDVQKYNFSLISHIDFEVFFTNKFHLPNNQSNKKR
ncbi:hypothetical protein, partial [Coprobacter tertius]